MTIDAQSSSGYALVRTIENGSLQNLHNQPARGDLQRSLLSHIALSSLALNIRQCILGMKEPRAVYVEAAPRSFCNASHQHLRT